ncbi:MAG: GAF domain-containing protein [Candidatus Riflebacteria bacterium]|nr:GAF domain-containing protein [Candidatus Riflebacteria bacterium]
MVKRIYLEEIIERELLKSFLARMRLFTGLTVVPFNDRGEAIFGDPVELFGAKDEILDLERLAGRDLITRTDGALIRVVRLSWRGNLYGIVLLGPYFPAEATKPGSEIVSSQIMCSKADVVQNIEAPTEPTSHATKSHGREEKKSRRENKIGLHSKIAASADVADKIRLTNEQILAAAELIEQFFSQQVEITGEREALRRKEKILSVLEEASDIMNSKLEFNRLLDFLMDIAIDITGATCGALLLKKESKRYLEVAVARGKYPQEVKKIRVPIGQGITGWVARNHESLIVPNVLLEPRYIETPETIYSEMAVPLLVGEKLIGVIAVDSSEINAFSKEDCATLGTLASMVTKVLENARLLAVSNQKVREITRLFSISERLLDGNGAPALIPAVLVDVAEALSCKGISLMAYDSDRDDLSMMATHGLSEEVRGLRIPMGKGIHGWVAQQRKPLLIQDTTSEASFVRYSLLDQFSRSSLTVPLLAGDHLIGVLSAYQKSEEASFQEDDERLLTAIGRILTVHFENRRLFDDSRRKLDYLTTLYQVSSSVSRTLNLAKLFGTILQQVQDVMDVENCSLMAYDSVKNHLSLDAAIGVPKKLVGMVNVPMGEGISGWVAKMRQPVLIKDIAKDERFIHHPGRMDYKTRSALSVPIIHNRNLLGVINVNNKRSGCIFDDDDLNLLIGISGQIAQAIANANLYERTEQQVAELSLIQELGKAINSSLDLDSVLTYFIDMTSRITDADRSTLMLFDDEKQELYVQAFRGFKEAEIRVVRFKIGEGIAGQAAQTRRPIRVINTHEDPLYTQLGVLNSAQPLTMISAPLVNRDKLVGVINCERELGRKGPFLPENLDLLDTLSSQASVAIENARLYHNLLNVYLETIRALAAAIDAKDSYTSGHSRRVTELSVALAQAMGLHREEVDTIRHAALLHDVGKIGISERILLKPGRLTDDEFETIKSHPHIGAGILNSIEFLKNVCSIIEHHHERFDGRGYPSGLKAAEIPLGARIIMVADSFDAITSSRPYRKPLTFAEATEEIRRCGGTQFDPKVVEAFVALRNNVFCPIWLKKEALEPETENESQLTAEIQSFPGLRI